VLDLIMADTPPAFEFDAPNVVAVGSLKIGERFKAAFTGNYSLIEFRDYVVHAVSEATGETAIFGPNAPVMKLLDLHAEKTFGAV